jgi:glyceraldehyde 3-phosphate dehydrogenase|eukprot:Tamp_06637.p3 GENE.Tamp_06637~~Tamp_06637.p3  ORF type:complete len:299 (-),score=107.11 Tamp_06637:1181-2077(-)
MLQFDTVHGRWKECRESADGKSFTVEGKAVSFSDKKTIGEVDWKGLGCQMVLECTGNFLTTAALQPYIDNGVDRVIVSAPMKEGILNVVMGVNCKKITGDMRIITCASCTTNCLAPVVKVVHEKLTIVKGMITTIHDVTGTQALVDQCDTGKKQDLRRGRSGLVNLSPTSTGSASAIAEVFPELKGKLNGLAIRVPICNGSLTDCVFEVGRDTTAEEVNGFLKEAAEGELKGILGYEERPLVSTDFVNEDRSGVVDAPSTMVVQGTMVKIYIWYDNEWGYSMRMADLTHKVAKDYLGA